LAHRRSDPARQPRAERNENAARQAVFRLRTRFGDLLRARVALTVDTDREALDIALACCLNVDPQSSRIARIRDTKSLEWLYVSEALLDEVLSTGRCELVGSLEPIACDARGALAGSLPA